MLIVPALPWAVYGWFVSDFSDDSGRFVSVDTQSLMISADLNSALLDTNSPEELTRASNESFLLGKFSFPKLTEYLRKRQGREMTPRPILALTLCLSEYKCRKRLTT